MKIGIIGIGCLTLELIQRAVQAGCQIVVNNPRGNSLVRDSISGMGADIEFGPIEKAANTDLVILFVPKSDLEDVIGSLPDMAGKTVIHTSNLMFDRQTLFTGIASAMTYKTTAALLPTAYVVKLLKPINRELGITSSDNSSKLYFIADHPYSKQAIEFFLKSLDFAAIDLSARLQILNLGYNDFSGTTATV